MFAVLHIADFALQAVLRAEPGEATRPAALFAGSGKKSVVLGANAAARAVGVEPGMTAPQAVARCATLTIRAPQPAAEAEARAALLAVGFSLSPSLEDSGPGICTADVRGLDPARRDVLACVAVSELAALGLPATAGLANTPLLALYAARAARPEPRAVGESALLPGFVVAEQGSARGMSARTTVAVAGTRAPGDGVLHVTEPGAFLAPQPLATADPSPELAAVFASWGLRTLGDLLRLPRDEIVRRFGQAGLALWQRAAGGAPRPLRPVAPPQSFSARHELEEEIETLEPLLFLLRRFLDRLALELRATQHVAAEIALTLQLSDETEHGRSFRLPEPTADVEILFRALHTHLESLQTAAAIRGLQLRLTPARPLVRQQGLFETGLRDPHGFAETLARVAALVGSDRVGTPQCEDTHRPDAVTLAPPLAVVPPAAEPPVHPPLGLPMRRFRPPLPANLEFTQETRQPTYLWTTRFHGAIAHVRGPWRSSGDWWQQDRAWARTEWDIGLADGGLYRLLLIGDAYFVEGEYD